MINKQITPIFLGGTGRSGTTILRDILLQSPSIVGCSNEIRFTVDPQGIIDLYDVLTNSWDPYRASTSLINFDNFVRKSISGNLFYALLRYALGKIKISPIPYRHIRLNISIALMLKEHEVFINSLHHSKSETIWYGSKPFTFNPKLYETHIWNESDLSRIFTEHFSKFFSAMQPNKINNKYWLDDTPYCVLHAKSLKKVFPKAKFIHIYRDPRNVLASYLHKVWGGNKKDVANIAHRIKTVYKKINLEKNSISKDDYINIRFEELVENPKIILHSISEKLNIPPEEIPTKGIRKSNVSNYSTFFTNKQLQTINTILSDEIKLYGISPN